MECANSSAPRSSTQSTDQPEKVSTKFYTLRDSLGRSRRIRLSQPPHYGIFNGDRLQPLRFSGKTGPGSRT